jgi:ERCC4-type nuclease
MKLHVMRYDSRELAQEHVKYLKEHGSEAIIEEVTVFDVYITRDFRVGDTSLDQR